MILASKDKVENCKCKHCTSADILNISGKLDKEMISFMIKKSGIGLAAPQIGIYKKFFVMKYGNEYITCFNPKILFRSRQKSSLKESCLTYGGDLRPHQRPTKNIMRAKTVKVEFQNVNGDIVTLKLRGMEAKCFQHEFDHLQGKTIFYRG